MFVCSQLICVSVSGIRFGEKVLLFEEWLASDIIKGSFNEKLPRPEQIVKVSRQQAKRARLVNKIAWLTPGGMHYKYQRGSKAEKLVLADLVKGAQGKKLLVFADPFMAVGDRAEAVLSMQQETSVDKLVFFFGSDPREHFAAISRIRVVSKTKEEFQEERLSISGFAPLPKIPAAWVGKTPDLTSARAQLKQALTTVSCREDGSLVIPADDDAVPVEINDALRETLSTLRKQFPPPGPREGYPSDVASGDTKFDSLEDLLGKMTVWKTIRKADFNLLVAGKGASFDCSQNAHGLWVENPSTSAKLELEAETFLCGVRGCKFLQESSGNYDPAAPCSIKLSRRLSTFVWMEVHPFGGLSLRLNDRLACS